MTGLVQALPYLPDEYQHRSEGEILQLHNVFLLETCQSSPVEVSTSTQVVELLILARNKNKYTKQIILLRTYTIAINNYFLFELIIDNSIIFEIIPVCICNNYYCAPNYYSCNYIIVLDKKSFMW